MHNRIFTLLCISLPSCFDMRGSWLSLRLPTHFWPSPSAWGRAGRPSKTLEILVLSYSHSSQLLMITLLCFKTCFSWYSSGLLRVTLNQLVVSWCEMPECPCRPVPASWAIWRARFCVPPPHVSEHDSQVLQSDHRQSTHGLPQGFLIAHKCMLEYIVHISLVFTCLDMSSLVPVLTLFHIKGFPKEVPETTIKPDQLIWDPKCHISIRLRVAPLAIHSITPSWWCICEDEDKLLFLCFSTWYASVDILLCDVASAYLWTCAKRAANRPLSPVWVLAIHLSRRNKENIIKPIQNKSQYIKVLTLALPLFTFCHSNPILCRTSHSYKCFLHVSCVSKHICVACLGFRACGCIYMYGARLLPWIKTLRFANIRLEE